ncbi:MAG: hypothetical protein PVJ98_11790 [Akkermansiaceae bacterium]
MRCTDPLAVAFDLPRGFFTMEKLDEARAEAAAKPKMVGFLITDPKAQLS